MPVHHFLLSSGLQLSHGSSLWAWLRSWEPETVPSLIPCCLQGTARGMAHLCCEHQHCHPSHSVGCSCCFSAPCKTKLSLESSCPPRAPLDPALAQPAPSQHRGVFGYTEAGQGELFLLCGGRNATNSLSAAAAGTGTLTFLPLCWLLQAQSFLLGKSCICSACQGGLASSEGLDSSLFPRRLHYLQGGTITAPPMPTLAILDPPAIQDLESTLSPTC